jgi:hypothetical protein
MQKDKCFPQDGISTSLKTGKASAKWSHYLLQGDHTIFRKVVIPSSARWSCYLPQSGRTIFRKMVVPFSAKWSCHFPQGGRIILCNILAERQMGRSVAC